jgi:hypothetical protein
MFALLFTAATMASMAVQADSQNAVGVTVNGTQISFPGTQPVEVHGSVLVPLRGVFESLGATVDYNSDTGTITAEKGNRHIRLPLNSSVATINGQPQDLSQPAQVVNGTTLVPLRFVAEAFGDYVEWSGPTHMVVIQTSSPSPAYLAHRGVDQADNQGTLVIGYVRRVITETTPMEVEVRVTGTNQIVALADSAVIRRGFDRDTTHSVALTDLQRGDHVAIRENAHGHAISVISTYGDRIDLGN